MTDSSQGPPPEGEGGANPNVGGASASVGGARSWEKAWPTEDIRKSAYDWSLAGDAGLLLHLHQFSQQLLARTHDMQTKINEVNREAKMTGVRMSNVVSDFIMLANNQFVENRVYDEDVSVTQNELTSGQDVGEKTQEQREAELIPKINQALTMGLDVLEIKDPYRNRPLPHLIGSISFMHEDSLGLPELSTAADEPPCPEPATMDREPQTHTASDQEIGGHTVSRRDTGEWGPGHSDSESEGDLFDSGEKDEDEDLFEESDIHHHSNEEDEDTESKGDSDQPANFLDELSNKFKGTSGEKPKTKEKNKAPTKGSKDNPAPSRDDRVRPQALQEDSPGDEDGFVHSGSRFSGRGGLFDADEDKEGGLFGASSTKSQLPAEKSSPKTDPKPTKQAKEPSRAKPLPKSGGLFGGEGSEEDEEDLFAAAAKTSRAISARSSKSASSRAGGGLFGEDSASGGEESSRSSRESLQRKPHKRDSPKRKVPAGGVSMFGAGGNPLLKSLRSEQQDDTPTDESGSDPDDDRVSSHQDTDTSSGADLMSAVTKGPPESHRKKHSIQVLPTPDEPKSGGLFDNDESSTRSKQNSSKIQQPSAEKRKPKQPSKVSIFDDDDADDLFSTMSAPKSKPVKKESSPAPGGLFDDDKDLFSSITKPSSTQKKAVSQPTKQKVLSLFDDEAVEEDIFSSSKSSSSGDAPPALSSRLSKPQKQDPAPTAKSRVFEDEDVLFGGAEDDPTVDLFGAGSPLSSPTKTEPPKPTTKAKTTTKPPGSSSDSRTATVSELSKDPPLPTDTPEVKDTAATKPKLPAAGTKPKSEKLKSEKPKSEKPKSEKPKSGFSLFDDESEDELFGTKSSVTEKPVAKATHTDPTSAPHASNPPTSVHTGARPKVPKENSLQKSTSIFDDDEEDLFALPSTKQPKQKPVQKPKPPKRRPSPQKQRPVHPPSSSRENSHDQLPQVSSDPLDFLSDSAQPQRRDVSSLPPMDDNTQRVPNAKNAEPVTVPSGPKPKRAEVDGSDDEDLFGERPKQNSEPPPSLPHPKKPAPAGRPPGAVSMFGGVAPSAVLGNRLRPQPVEVEVEGDEDARSASVLPQAGAVGPSGASADGEGVRFDQPVQALVLQSATKSRARLARGRRPPTRRDRTLEGATASSPPSPAAGADVDAFFPDSVDSSLPNGIGTPPLGGSGVAEGSPERSGASSSSLERSRDKKASKVDNDDIFGDVTDSKGHSGMSSLQSGVGSVTKSGVTKPPKVDVDDMFGVDVSVSNSENGSSTSIGVIQSTKVDNADDDIFGDAGAKVKSKQVSDPHPPSDQNVLPNAVSADIITEKSSEEIFPEKSSENVNRIKNNPVVTKPKTKSSKQASRNVLSDDDDEDIFADSVPSTAKHKAKADSPTKDLFSNGAPENSLNTNPDIFTSSSSSRPTLPAGDILSDNKPATNEDIFGDLSSSKTASKISGKKADAPDIFGTSSSKDEDIFGPSSSNSNSAKPKPAVSKATKEASEKKKAKADDLFSDDTDIFADVTATKPRVVKTKSENKSKSGLFSADVDDIFATTKPQKKTQAKSKPKSKVSNNVIDDIFGDSSPSIFDDPLSATKLKN